MKFFKKKSKLLIFLLIKGINALDLDESKYNNEILKNIDKSNQNLEKYQDSAIRDRIREESKNRANKIRNERAAAKEATESAIRKQREFYNNQSYEKGAAKEAAKWSNRLKDSSVGKFLTKNKERASKFLTENKAAPAIVGSAIGIGFGLLLEKIIRFNDEFQQLPDAEKNEYIKKNKRKIEDDKDYIENNLNNNLINNLNNIYLKIKNNKDFKLDKNDKETIKIGKNIIERFGFIGALKDNNNGINNWYEKLFKKIIKTDGRNEELKNELQYKRRFINDNYYIEELKDTYLFKIINEINRKIEGISNSDFWKNNKNKIYKAGIGAGVMTGLGIAGYIWHKNNKSKKLKLREKRRNAIKDMNYKFNK